MVDALDSRASEPRDLSVAERSISALHLAAIIALWLVLLLPATALAAGSWLFGAWRDGGR